VTIWATAASAPAAPTLGPTPRAVEMPTATPATIGISQWGASYSRCLSGLLEGDALSQWTRYKKKLQQRRKEALEIV